MIGLPEMQALAIVCLLMLFAAALAETMRPPTGGAGGAA